MAASRRGLYSTTRLGSIPQEAMTTTFGAGILDPGRQLAGREPPNTTECTAPILAQASIATTASGTIGM